MIYEPEARVWALPKHGRYGCGRYITLDFVIKLIAIVWHCVAHPALWVCHCHITAILGNLGRCTSDAVPSKCIISFVDVTSLNNAVTSYMMSQHCKCVGHMTIYYKRAANASVGGSFL